MACFPNQIRDISRIVITVHFTKGTLRNVSVIKDLGRMSEVLSLRTQRFGWLRTLPGWRRESFLFVLEGDRIIKSFSSSPVNLFFFLPFNLEFYFLTHSLIISNSSFISQQGILENMQNNLLHRWEHRNLWISEEVYCHFFMDFSLI